MAKVKVDFKALQPMLLQYGDKAALGLCAVSSLLLITLGLVGAQKASKTDYAAMLKSASETLNQKILSAPPPPEDPKKMAELNPDLYKWNLYVSTFAQGPFIHLTEQADTKRRNPVVALIREGEDNIQIDYKQGLYYSYPIDPLKGTIEVFSAGADAKAAAPGNPAGGPREIVKNVDALRMVIVSTVFPMREQVDLFKKAFRLNTQQELFNLKDSLPRPVAVEVNRYEVMPDGSLNPNKVPLYTYDKDKDRVIVAAPIDAVLRRAMIDDDRIAELRPFLYKGLATPLPLLANTKYDKLTLQAFDVPPDPNAVAKGPQGGATMPGGPGGMQGGAGGGGTIKAIGWRQLTQAGPDMQYLVDRFEGRFDPFHPLALRAEAGAATTVAAGPGPGMAFPGRQPAGGAGAGDNFYPLEAGLGAGGAPGAPVAVAAGFPTRAEGGGGPRGPFNPGIAPQGNNPGAPSDIWRNDAMVRFIDVGVEPGKTYRYEMRVILANPNFGKPTEVAFAALANEKVLYPPKFTHTPPKTIPNEYYIYAVDQLALDDPKKANKDLGKDQIPLQIQRWYPNIVAVQEGAGQNHPVGDWLVYERQLVRRGEFIGHHQMITPVPLWSKEKGEFYIGKSFVDSTGGKKKEMEGTPVDFVPPPEMAKKGAMVTPPLLVDFEGGLRKDVFVQKGLPPISRDEATIEALIMSPNGVLTVRSARIDSDPTTADGHERKLRLDEWREHVDQAKAGSGASGNQPGAPNLPGLGLPGVTPRKGS
jgi:hypothetical protein